MPRKLKQEAGPRKESRPKRASTKMLPIDCFRKLPPELKLVILDRLSPREQFNFAITSHENWEFARYRMCQIGSSYMCYRSIGLDDHSSPNEPWKLLDRLLSNPERLEFVEEVNLRKVPPAPFDPDCDDSEDEVSLPAKPKKLDLSRYMDSIISSDFFHDERWDAVSTDLSEQPAARALMDGERGPVLALILTLVRNVRRLELSGHVDDTLVTMILDKIAQAYLEYSEQNIPPPMNLPLRHLRELYLGPNGGLSGGWVSFKWFDVFLDIPSLEMLRGDRILGIDDDDTDIFYSDNESDSSFDYWRPIKRRPKSSNLRKLILTGEAPDITHGLISSLVGIKALEVFYLEDVCMYEEPFPHGCIAFWLSKLQGKSLRQLWLQDSETEDSEMDKTLARASERCLRIILKCQIESRFPKLTLLSCRWCEVMNARQYKTELLNKNLEVLAIRRCPDRVPIILSLLAPLKKLKRIYITAGEVQDKSFLDRIRHAMEAKGVEWMTQREYKKLQNGFERWSTSERYDWWDWKKTWSPTPDLSIENP